MQQALGNGLFVMEDKVQRPDGNADHNQHIRQGAKLHVDLVGDDRHGNQQTVTNQSTEHAEAQRPVSGALIPNREGTKIRYVRAKYQTQQRLKELDQRKGVEEERLLESDGFIAGVKPVGQDLAHKQRQRQQQ